MVNFEQFANILEGILLFDENFDKLFSFHFKIWININSLFDWIMKYQVSKSAKVLY